MRKLLLPLICIGLTACAERVDERRGTELKVVPITYSIDIDIKSNKTRQAWDELDKYVNKHWDIIATQAVNIYWSSKSGKKLADKYANYLLSKGIDSEKLYVTKSPDRGTDLEFPEDLRLETVVNKVIVSACGYEAIGNFGREANGCYVQNARWQSMVNPEKMLIKK
ncbi:hypothetical protein P7F88_07665 [Vibrio hannami]|uniref:hypothetical protein n=1 Tax=Vibrio hannami TaxID=2717094 RepID=UPI002410771D|nr:hypothetical protein [Vibrio hannami]MDG3085978.1 hypothetical protein [Vibrio hannami]